MQQLLDPRHSAAKVGPLMRIHAVLLSIAAFGSTAALGDDDCRCWTPSAQDIATLEARIKVSPTPLGLDRYVRYYGGVIRSGDSRRFIQGKLVPPSGNDIPGIQVVRGKMPPLLGKGCVSYSDNDGRWLYFRCARPGAWTPSDAQIEGAMNGETFKAYVEQFLAPIPKKDDIVFTVNASVHMVERVEEAIEAVVQFRSTFRHAART